METERYRTEPGGPRYGLQVAKVKAYAVIRKAAFCSHQLRQPIHLRTTTPCMSIRSGHDAQWAALCSGPTTLAASFGQDRTDSRL